MGETCAMGTAVPSGGRRRSTSPVVRRPRASRLGGVVTVCSALALVMGWAAPVAAATPADHSETTFLGISCTAAGDCTAVGAFGTNQTAPDVGPRLEPIYATESAGRWGLVHEIPDPGGNGTFTSVSCVSAEDCTAVGFDYSHDYSSHGFLEVGYPIYAVETAGRWGAVKQVKDVSGQGTGATFDSVSCTAPSDCTAVGNGPVYATESAGVWGPATYVPDVLGNFEGVSCTSAGNCTAVGGDETCECDYGVLVPNLPIHASEVAGVWGPVAEVAGPTGSSFTAVSCPSATGCVAVGGASPGGSTFADVESAGSWDPLTSITLPGFGELSDVSCWAVDACAAVGSVLRPGSTTYETVHLAMRAGAWGPPSAAGGGSLEGISCRSSATCGAVGSYDVCSEGTSTCNDPGNFAIYTGLIRGAWPSVPGPPKLGEVTALDHSLHVTWTAPALGRSSVTGYVAMALVSTGGGLVDERLCTTTGARNCTIRGLVNAKHYTVAVLARSDAGTSATSGSRVATPR